jgi:hypothetical protein
MTLLIKTFVVKNGRNNENNYMNKTLYKYMQKEFKKYYLGDYKSQDKVLFKLSY